MYFHFEYSVEIPSYSYLVGTGGSYGEEAVENSLQKRFFQVWNTDGNSLQWWACDQLFKFDLTAEDPKNLSQLTPAMFIQDIETVGVPDLEHLNEVNITNHFFKYQQWQRKDLWNMFRSTWVFQLNKSGRRTNRNRSRWFSPSLMQETKIDWTGQRRTRCSYLPCRWQWHQGEVRTGIWEMTRPVQMGFPIADEPGQSHSPMQWGVKTTGDWWCGPLADSTT